MKTGETNLSAILKSLSPVLNQGSYVFCSVVSDRAMTDNDVICMFREEEGTTLIMKKERADAAGLQYSVVMSWITLNIHSSLEAYGLTAAFSNALAEANVSCNVVAGVYHDHIFVPRNDADKAMTVLKKLSS